METASAKIALDGIKEMGDSPSIDTVINLVQSMKNNPDSGSVKINKITGDLREILWLVEDILFKLSSL